MVDKLEKAVTTLSPGARVTLGLFYMLTRRTKTPKTEQFIQFLFDKGIKTEEDIATSEIIDELFDAGCFDQEGQLTALGATWSEHFGTRRQLPNDIRLPKNLKVGLSKLSAVELAEISKQCLIILAHNAVANEHSPSQVLFDRAIKKGHDLDIKDFAAEY